MSQVRGICLASSGVCRAVIARELLQQKNCWKSSLGVLYVFHACMQVLTVRQMLLHTKQGSATPVHHLTIGHALFVSEE